MTNESNTTEWMCPSVKFNENLSRSRSQTLTISFLADWLGRKQTVFIGSIISVFGCTLQAGATTISTLIAGRVISGHAVGLLSAIVPMYCSEIRVVRSSTVDVKLGFLHCAMARIRLHTFQLRFPMAFLSRFSGHSTSYNGSWKSRRVGSWKKTARKMRALCLRNSMAMGQSMNTLSLKSAKFTTQSSPTVPSTSSLGNLFSPAQAGADA